MIIRINGKEIETTIDESGIQRLPHNRIISHLMRTHSTLDYNTLSWKVQEGEFSEEERRFIYQNVGYSVCGYADIFPDDEIENPMWED